MDVQLLFTGVEDVDREILLNVKAKRLGAVCSVNKYSQTLCDATFWRRRFEKDYGVLGESERMFDYHKAYYLVDLDNMRDTIDRAVVADMIPLVEWTWRRYDRITTEQELDMLYDGVEILVKVVENGQLGIVQLMIGFIGKNLNENTYLELVETAIMNNHLSIVRYFIEEIGIDYVLDVRTLRYLVEAQIFDTFRYLITRSNEEIRISSLILSVRYHAFNYVKYIVETLGVDVNAVDGEVLYSAVYDDNLDLLIYLIKHGGDVAHYGPALLEMAIGQGATDIATYLVETLHFSLPSNAENLALGSNRRSMRVYIESKLPPQTTETSQVAEISTKRSVPSSDNSDRQCIATTLTRTRCKKTVKPGKQYCSIHLKK